MGLCIPFAFAYHFDDQRNKGVIKKKLVEIFEKK